MKLVIEIKMDNAAFVDDGGAPEAARILRKIAVQFDRLGASYEGEKLRDVNGNECGYVGIMD